MCAYIYGDDNNERSPITLAIFIITEMTYLTQFPMGFTTSMSGYVPCTEMLSMKLMDWKVVRIAIEPHDPIFTLCRDIISLFIHCLVTIMYHNSLDMLIHS
jgi:hypothetical protein